MKGVYYTAKWASNLTIEERSLLLSLVHFGLYWILLSKTLQLFRELFCAVVFAQFQTQEHVVSIIHTIDKNRVVSVKR